MPFELKTPTAAGEGQADDDAGTLADDGAAEQAELEAGMRQALAAAGVTEKPTKRTAKKPAVLQ
jgi:hypothetical protein